MASEALETEIVQRGSSQPTGQGKCGRATTAGLTQFSQEDLLVGVESVDNQIQ